MLMFVHSHIIVILLLLSLIIVVGIYNRVQLGELDKVAVFVAVYTVSVSIIMYLQHFATTTQALVGR